MNQNIKPLTALIVLLFFGGLLWGKFWFRDAALEILTFPQIPMHKYPDGTAYIQLDNHLFGFNDKAEISKTIDLSRLGIISSEAATDFAFFANGDLLLHSQLRDGGFIDNLQRYFRFTNLQDKNSGDVMTGLLRCNVTSYQCQSFSDPPLTFLDASTLSIDWQTDRVFVASAILHKVRMFSASGKELDAMGGFNFPNQIHFQDHRLYVADTNHHTVTALAVDGNRLLIDPENIFANAYTYFQSESIWPSSFLIIGDQIWIGNARDNTEHDRIYIFDKQGHFVKRLKLPKHADPYALLQLGQTVLISDFSLGKVYQFSLEGEALPDFQPTVFQPLLENLKTKKVIYQNLDLAFTAAFALSLLGGFGYALFSQKGRRLLLVNTSIPDSQLANGGIHWINFCFRFKMFLRAIALIEVISITTLFVYLYIKQVSFFYVVSEFFQQYFLFVIYVFFCFIFMPKQIHKKIGISDQYVVVISVFGKPIKCLKADIFYSDKYVLIGKMIFYIKHLKKMYAQDDIAQWLYPAIKQGRYLEPLKMKKLLMKKMYIQIFWALVTAILIVLFDYYGLRA